MIYEMEPVVFTGFVSCDLTGKSIIGIYITKLKRCKVYSIIKAGVFHEL